MYLKVWIYLLIKAQHTDYKKLKKGQLYTSIPEIQEACTHVIGYRKERPTKDQIFQILSWLRFPHESNCESNTKATMIATTKATQGMIVTLCNYNFYQDFSNYGSNDESNDEKATKPIRKQRQPSNINKNAKNEKNSITNPLTPLETEIENFKEFRRSIKKPMPERAVDLMRGKLQKLAPDNKQEQIAILQQSIMNGYQGVFAIKEDFKQQCKQNGFQTGNPFLEMLKEEQGGQS